MKNWLLEKNNAQNSLFKELLEKSIETLKTFNADEKKNISVRVIFTKDEWLDGSAKLEILQMDNDDEYTVTNKHTHYVYHTNQDIYANSTICKLMRSGLFTNFWFSTLNTSHNYDTTFIITSEKYILENDNCEFREERMKETHKGFNILSPQEKKLNRK